MINYVKRVLVILIALIVSVDYSYADPTKAPQGEAAGIFGEGTGIQGEANLTGAMQYAYEFRLPEARGGPQPQLALAYNSSSGDGEGGYGWSLTLPTIELKPLSGFPEFSEDGRPKPFGHERYVYNGQPLVFICEIGTTPELNIPDCADDPVSQPAWATKGWRYYRLQVEGLFLRFYLSPNLQYWRVQVKGGEVMEFGEPPNLSLEGVERARGNAKAIVRWRLVRHFDAMHLRSNQPVNVVHYRWRSIGKRGLLYLTDVYDTAPENGSDQLHEFAHHTRLTWVPPKYHVTSYADVDKARPDLLLNRVAVSSKSWSGTGPREVIRVYTLKHTTGNDLISTETDIPLWHHSFLQEIRIQGDCKHTEDAHENIPQHYQCVSLPPVTFEYQIGRLMFTGGLSKIEGGPSNLDVDYRVLPHLSSTAVVDFNGDGMPDVVQSWEAEPRCFDEDGVTYIGDDGNLRCVQTDGSSQIIRSARPLVGYLNRGWASAPVSFKFQHQCMDAGKLGDMASILQKNIPFPPAFFTGHGTSLIGTWGEGIVAWGMDSYLPYFARPTLPDGSTSMGCDLFNFRESEFVPAWRWERAAAETWTKPADIKTDVESGFSPRWFTDVDGDGLMDLLGANGQTQGRFESAFVHFTRRYAKGEQNTARVTGPAQVPFQYDFKGAHGIVPAAINNLPSYLRPESRYFFIDVNGDGLNDLVSYVVASSDTTGIPEIRPGNGRGQFACDDMRQSWPCLPKGDNATPAYRIEVTGPIKPWPMTSDTYFHDVTGDGLADIIKYVPETGTVQLWINKDGQEFACANSTCNAGVLIDNLHGKTNLNGHRLTFADMNADGVNDIVVLGKAGVLVGTVVHTDLFGIHDRRGPSPGLLTAIHNGYGAITKISYKTVQELDLESERRGVPWKYHLPSVETVVVQLVTESEKLAGVSLPEPYAYKRTVQYEYRDPAYDTWERRLAGFRTIRVKLGDESAVTETTYWFGPCQNQTIERGPSLIIPSLRCPNGSDDDEFASINGQAVRIDRFIPSGAWITPNQKATTDKHLWTKIFKHGISRLFGRSDRQVTMAHPNEIITYYYDDSKPIIKGKLISVIAGGDPVEEAPEQDGIRKRVRREMSYDDQGSVLKTIEHPVTTDGEVHTKGADRQTITVVTEREPSQFGLGAKADQVRCTSDWQCLPTFVSTWEWKAGAPIPTLGSLIRYSYTNSGDLSKIEGWLEEGGSLQRRHEGGGQVAVLPTTAMVSKGWHTLSTYEYDSYGNQVKSISGDESLGTSQPCVATAFDPSYAQLPSMVRVFAHGCDSEALETKTNFHRGFASPIESYGANGGKSRIELDAFGRAIRIFAPRPDTNPAQDAIILTEEISYIDQKPNHLIDVKHVLEAGKTERFISLFNGLGELIIDFHEVDQDKWILSNWTERNVKGNIDRIRQPWDFAGNPVSTAISSSPIAIPPGNSVFAIGYDGFGRRRTLASSGALLSSTTYFPLAVEIRDAEQLKTDGPHAKAYSRLEYDGQMRTIRTIEHLGSPASQDVITDVLFSATGQINEVKRTSSDGGQQYVRRIEYDTLGRMYLNSEPNTGNNLRYVWDKSGRLVGSSDARGCGVNIYYDGLSRITGKDYSPCLGSHPPYTPPDIQSGIGFEEFYSYDHYEDGQKIIEPSFVDHENFALGQLISAKDRGSYTRFNYDIRGRTRRIARQASKPDNQTTASSSYAPHWFISRFDYDGTDRLVRRTSGTEVKEFLVGGKSEETFKYSTRGLERVDTSYGPIIKKLLYSSDSGVNQIIYGDLAETKAEFSYDNRKRLQRYHVSRMPVGMWVRSTAHSYPFPDGSTTQTDLLDYNFSSLDEVGNPLIIEDKTSGLWPASAAIMNKRQMKYDDLYRMTSIDYSYKTADGSALWTSPFEAEISSGNAAPMPTQTMPTRISQQAYAFDGLGNIISSIDPSRTTYDRSLGANIEYGSTSDGPNQLRSAEGILTFYDESGNVTDLLVERSGKCRGADGASRCAQRLRYDWDEVGQLTRARRWDFEGNTIPSQNKLKVPPGENPSIEIIYSYSSHGRMHKTIKDSSGHSQHTLQIFDSLRIEHAAYDESATRYIVTKDNTHLNLGGIAHIFWDSSSGLPRPARLAEHQLLTTYLTIPDHLGSSIIVIDHSTSELVERTTYQAFGAVESDYRPSRWNNFRLPYKFTGKPDDIEVGLVYFGARYYHPHLGVFISADPLTIHDLGSDLNPYTYVGGRVATHIDPFGLLRCGRCGEELPEIDGVQEVHVHGPPRHDPDLGARAEAAQRRRVGFWGSLFPAGLSGGTRPIPTALDHGPAHWKALRQLTAGAGNEVVAGGAHAAVAVTAAGSVGIGGSVAVGVGGPGAVAAVTKTAEMTSGVYANAGRWLAGKFPLLVPTVAGGTSIAAGLNGNANSSTVVFRAITASERQAIVAGQGIIAKAPGGSWTAAEHVANLGPGVGGAAANSPWISTTKNLDVARAWAGGNGVVAIDLHKITSFTTEVWKHAPRVNGPGGLAYHRSIWSQEVTVFQRIDAEAIIGFVH